MEFKDRIKAVRIEYGDSPAQLAAFLNKSESAVRAWEIERSKPDADTLIRLAEHFGCTTDYLLGLSDHRNSNEKADISTLSNDIEEAILKVDDGKDLLEGLVRLINIIPEIDRSYIVAAYLGIAKDFALALEEIYKLHTDCKTAEDFSFTNFFECYSNMSNTLVSSKNKLFNLSERTLEQMVELVTRYGNDVDINLVDSFCRMYQTAHCETDVAAKVRPKPKAKTNGRGSSDIKANRERMEKMSRLVNQPGDKYKIGVEDKTRHKNKPLKED